MFKEALSYQTEAVSLDEMAKIIAEEDLGIVPTVEKVQREIDVPLRKKRQSLKFAVGIGVEVPLDSVTEQEMMSLSESLPDLEGYIRQVDLTDSIRNALASLDKNGGSLGEREKFVLVLRMGLQGNEKLTLNEIGKVFRVSSQRIRQMETRALRKLRYPSRAKFLRDFVKNNIGMGEKTEALQNGLVNAIHAGDKKRVERITDKLRETSEGRDFLAQLRGRRGEIVIEPSPASTSAPIPTPTPTLSNPEVSDK